MGTSSNYLPEGYRLESYIIEKVLGAGGFGVTYLAKDIHLNTQVVIKEFLPQEFSTRESGHQTIVPYTDSKENSTYEYLLKKFLKEAQILASIKHPNVVRVFSFFEANNTAYFVMDYIAGESLKSYLERKSEVDEETIFSIMIPILEGLKEVHFANYLHRDIAPDNIYLRQNGMPMLIDFGAAKNASRAESTSLAAIVKAGYSAPEQYTTNAEQNATTDIYAIGSVLYSMVSKKVAPESTIRQMALLNDEPDPLEDVRQNRYYKKRYSKVLLETIHKALSIRTKDRFQDVMELQQSLFSETTKQESLKTELHHDVKNKKNVPEKLLGKKLLLTSIMAFAVLSIFAFFLGEEGVVNEPTFLVSTSVDDTKYSEPKTSSSKNMKEACDSGASCLELAKNFYKNNQNKEVAIYTKKACDLGSREGCGLLSLLYFEGVEIKQDYEKALALGEQSCNNGDAIGCFVHGVMHHLGKGGAKQDTEDATRFYKKAEKISKRDCDNNDAEACSNLGIIYASDLISSKSKSDAVPFFQKACAGDDREACTQLGLAYSLSPLEDWGIEQDVKKSFELFKKACDLKDSEGCARLGFSYEIQQNNNQAIKYYKQACNMSSAMGCKNAGYFYERVHKDLKSAKKYYKKACGLGYAEVCSKN